MRSPFQQVSVLGLVALALAGCATPPTAEPPPHAPLPRAIDPLPVPPPLPTQPPPGPVSSGAPVVQAESAPLLGADQPSTPNTPVVVFRARAGSFLCELGRIVDVKQVAADANSLTLNWSKRDHVLTGGHTASGALRYENAQAGLAWIIIPGKAMLLDTRRGQQLANECKPR